MLRAFLAVLLLLPLVGAGQQPVFSIDLRDQPLQLPEARFYIADVLDLRDDRGSIGWVQPGAGNARVAANLSGGVAPNFKQWLQSQLPPRPGARPVVMRINELRVSELTTARAEKAKVSVDVDFLVQQPDSNYYVLLWHTDEEERTGDDVTSLHAGNLAACLRRGLTALQALPWEERLTRAQPIAPERLTYRKGHALEVNDYPILVAAAPTRGLYPDFLSFRRNAPQPSPEFELKRRPRTHADWKGTDEVTIYARNGSSRTAIDDVWGFSDGQQAYIRHFGHYYPLRRAGTDYVFTGRSGVDENASTAASIGTGLARGVGVPLLGAVGTVAALSTKGLPEEYTLHLMTGRVSDFEYLANISQRDTATIMVYRWSGTGPMKPLPVLLNGNELGQLAGNDYLRIAWPNKAKEVTLTVPGPKGTTYEFIPDFTAVNYVALRAKSDDAEPKLEPVGPKDGAYKVSKMRRVGR